MSASPSFAATPNVGVQHILPADTTTKKTLVTGGASGSKVTALAECPHQRCGHGRHWQINSDRS
jgi:hypothetical protein